MASVKYDDLLDAFDLVSSDPTLTAEAYICLETGRIFCIKDWMPPEAGKEIPDDLTTSDRYLSIPHKSDFDLGKRLALRFAERQLPERYLEQAEEFFRHRGAYAHFKQMLEREGALDKWHTFEADAVKEALKDWCTENDIELVG